jgi:hypothetical protein
MMKQLAVAFAEIYKYFFTRSTKLATAIMIIFLVFIVVTCWINSIISIVINNSLVPLWWYLSVGISCTFVAWIGFPSFVYWIDHR